MPGRDSSSKGRDNKNLLSQASNVQTSRSNGIQTRFHATSHRVDNPQPDRLDEHRKLHVHNNLKAGNRVDKDHRPNDHRINQMGDRTPLHRKSGIGNRNAE